MDIPILRPSASRVSCIKESTKSILEKIRFKGELPQILHEDVLDIKQSLEILDWAYSQKCFERVVADYPPLRQGHTMDWLINTVQSKYFMFWEDDFVLERAIDLNDVVHLMENNPKINQIVFHKRETMPERGVWQKKEVVIDGQVLTTSPNWSFLPAIWRTDFIKNWWVCPGKHAQAASFEVNRSIKQVKPLDGVTRDADWMIKHVGTYFWGGIGNALYVNHIGNYSVRMGKTYGD